MLCAKEDENDVVFVRGGSFYKTWFAQFMVIILCGRLSDSWYERFRPYPIDTFIENRVLVHQHDFYVRIFLIKNPWCGTQAKNMRFKWPHGTFDILWLEELVGLNDISVEDSFCHQRLFQTDSILSVTKGRIIYVKIDTHSFILSHLLTALVQAPPLGCSSYFELQW